MGFEYSAFRQYFSKMERYAALRGRFYLNSIIKRLKDRGKTNAEIGDILGCSIATVKYAVGQEQESHQEAITSMIGGVETEYLRVAAVNKCKEVLAVRGWQVGESDAKCEFDLFALKNNVTKKIQVRSTSVNSQRGWPRFKTCKTKFNTKRVIREQYKGGDFDLWFFYSLRGSWMVPFAEVTTKAEISMEGFDQYFIL